MLVSFDVLLEIHSTFRLKFLETPERLVLHTYAPPNMAKAVKPARLCGLTAPWTRTWKTIIHRGEKPGRKDSPVFYERCSANHLVIDWQTALMSRLSSLGPCSRRRKKRLQRPLHKTTTRLHFTWRHQTGGGDDSWASIVFFNEMKFNLNDPTIINITYWHDHELPVETFPVRASVTVSCHGLGCRLASEWVMAKDRLRSERKSCLSRRTGGQWERWHWLLSTGSAFKGNIWRAT